MDFDRIFQALRRAVAAHETTGAAGPVGGYMWPLMADEHGIMVTTSDRQGRPVGPAYWVPDDESDDVLSFARAALGRPSPRAWVWTMATAPSRVSLLGRFPDLSGKRRRR